mgnify:CR=1 FL=1
MYRATVLASLIAMSSAAYSDSPVPLIPVVPASKAKANLVPPPPIAKKRSVKTVLPKGVDSTKKIDRSQITMQAGVNEIVQVAVSHLNRIVTPYEHPKVTTSSQATVDVRDNVIYIGSTSESPLTLFITEKGSEDQALSLTLIPKKIPPREIFLKLSATDSQSPMVTRKAEKWEKSQPYLLTIQTLFKAIALGELPTGYGFAKPLNDKSPYCRQTGLTFDFSKGQTISGHNLVVYVGVAENTSSTSIEFIEDTCGNWDVSAVAAFPRNALDPGEKTEIYVAKKKHYKREIKVERPSLLSGGV